MAKPGPPFPTPPLTRATLEVLLDRAQNGLLLLSGDGVIVYANQYIAWRLGLRRTEIVRRPLGDFVAEHDCQTFAATLAAACAGSAGCRVTLARSGNLGEMYAAIALAPMGRGHLSCMVADVDRSGREARHMGILMGQVSTMLAPLSGSLAALKGQSFEPRAQAALESIERQIARTVELMEELRRRRSLLQGR